MNIGIIRAFIADQRVAKSIVFQELGVPPDIKAIEWSMRHSAIMAKYQEKPFADVFYPHGYGLELQIGDRYIDFDYSREGRQNGFDEWRIFVYLIGGWPYNDSHPSDDLLNERVRNWFEKLEAEKRIERLDNLYYFTSD